MPNTPHAVPSPDEPFDDAPDFPAVQRGDIPWSAEEFWAVAEHEMRLIDTPHDDWDRRPQRFAVDLGRGPEVFRFNRDIRTNQVLSFMADRYRPAGMTTSASHMTRYLVIKEFIKTHHAQLVQDDFVRPEDGRQEGISMALLDVLAVAPYAPPPANVEQPHWPTFDYATVTAATWRRMAADEADDEKAPHEQPGTSSAGTTASQTSSAGTAPSKRPGRNDLCPCGSGKKFKRCCGRP